MVAFLSLLAAASAAFALPSSHIIKDEVKVVPHGYTQVGRAPAHAPIKLRIGLPQPNFAQLEEKLYAVSMPDHANYGKHLSKDEVDALVAPHPESLRLVDEWLVSHGLEEGSHYYYSDANDWVTLNGVNVGQVEKMLGCEYHVFKHESTGTAVIRTLSYGIPLHLAEHVDVIQPTTYFTRPQKAISTLIDDDQLKAIDTEVIQAVDVTAAKASQDLDPVLLGCNQTFTPECLSRIYNYKGYVPRTNIGNHLGIAGYLEEWASQADLKTFYQKFLPAAANSTFDVVLLNGGVNNQSAPGGEANLDVQYAGAVSYPIHNTYYSVGGRPPFIPDVLIGNENSNEPYIDFLEALTKDPKPPQVISTSYDDDEQTVPKDYAIRVCNTFAQLGARGVSFLFSSGDGGVAGCQTPPYCASNDGKNTTKFIPTFPSSCPYVTSIGATRYVYPEQAAAFSSGGFSEYFKTPLYQVIAAKGFLKQLGGTYKGLYNPSGRGIPDISAQGVRYQVFNYGKQGNASGTSASTPTMAGIISLLNDHRIRNGAPALGWLNPWLYTVGQLGFVDITRGSNPGCGTTGFNATEGWDPVTGLGTPDFQKLKKLAWPFGY